MRMSKWSIFGVCVIVLLFVYVGYWYAYGREREILSPSEARSAWAQIFAPAAGRLTLTPHGSGSTVSGGILSNKEDWIINNVYIHVRIKEKQPCPEKPSPLLENDPEWKDKCASDPAHSQWDKVVAGQAYKCFTGALAYGECATCSANTLLSFDPSKQTWDFFFDQVTGHPEDPLRMFQ
jgi:hypothetical protein